MQRIRLSKQALRDVDEAPYRAFIAGGGDLVMLSTAIYPALSPDPAAFSRAILLTDLPAAERAWRALVAKLRAGALDREEFGASTQRVLDLRRELAPR